MGLMPLIIAAMNGRHGNVKLLLGCGAECGVDMKSDNGDTALSHAVWAGDYKIVRLLVNSGRVKDLTDKAGKPLHHLARDTGVKRLLTELERRGDGVSANMPALISNGSNKRNPLN
jgi:ankyrin repeat protein